MRPLSSLLIFAILCTTLFFLTPNLTAHASTELLTNGDFEVGDSTGWTVIQNGGSGAGFGSLYSTSYTWCSISQTVDLVAAGFSEATLDAAPDIHFNVETFQRFDHDGYYYLEYKLLAADGNTVIDEQLTGSAGSPIHLVADTDWFDTEHTFSGYGAGARYAYIKIAGQDGSPDWGGQYGPYFDNATALISAAEDSTPPSVSTLTPADNATGVSADTTLKIEFDEVVDAETGNITIKRKSDDITVETIDVTGGQVSGSGTTTITITPSVDLTDPTGEGYYVQIDATAFDDASSNSYAGISDADTWNFRMVAAASSSVYSLPPEIVSIYPADNEESANIDTELAIRFNQTVYVDPGDIILRNDENGSTIDTINTYEKRLSGWGSGLINIKLNEELDYDTRYYVLIDSTAFKNDDGVMFDGIQNPWIWNFKTEPASEMEDIAEPETEQDEQSEQEEETTNSETPTETSSGSGTTQTQLGYDTPVNDIECADLSASHWVYNIVKVLLAVQNYPIEKINDSYYCNPDGFITRGELMEWLMVIFYPDEVTNFEETKLETIAFADVSADNLYAKFIIIAYGKGIVNGYDDGKFKPDKNTNRAELIKIITNLLDVDIKNVRANYAGLEPAEIYDDIDDGSAWFYPYLYFATAQELTEGRIYEKDGATVKDFAANEPILYAEAAKILFLAKWLL